MADNQIAGTTRHNLMAEYDRNKVAYKVSTRPYISRLPFVWSVVEARPVGGPFTVAFAKLTRGQANEYFGFGQGDTIQLTTTTTKRATASDTNQALGKSTNGIEDFAIESVSCTIGQTRAEYADAAFAPLAFTDADVIAAFKGQLAVKDPGSLLMPPQAGSPFNLEDALGQALRQNVSVRFVWDSSVQIPIGTLNQVAEGGANSYLHASGGQPSVDNRYKIPEGYSWRAKSRTDGSFYVVAEVTDTVVCPLNLIPLAGQGATNAVPTALYNDVTMRVHGLGFYNFSNN